MVDAPGPGSASSLARLRLMDCASLVSLDRFFCLSRSTNVYVEGMIDFDALDAIAGTGQSGPGGVAAG
ncbi:MAG: hypothetical protein ACYCX7_07285, partial [Solirubrobacteraceae bacterium]